MVFVQFHFVYSLARKLFDLKKFNVKKILPKKFKITKSDLPPPPNSNCKSAKVGKTKGVCVALLGVDPREYIAAGVDELL